MSTFPESPSINIGGKTFSVPPLAARSIVKFISIFGKVKKMDASQMEEAELLRLYEAVYLGVAAADPKVKFDDFMSWPITFDEIGTALFAIAPMAGMTIEVKKPGDPPAGEAEAGPDLTSIGSAETSTS